VRRKKRTLARTLKGGWWGSLGLECTTLSHKAASASLLLYAVDQFYKTVGNALRNYIINFFIDKINITKNS